MKASKGERTFAAINAVVMVLVGLTMLYPFLNSLAKSWSSNGAVMRGEVFVWPKGFNTYAYQEVLRNRQFLRSLLNTVTITVGGTALGMITVICAAYAMSKRNLLGRRIIFMYFLFSMLFSGGIIPKFLQIRNLGMYDTLWALFVPGLMNVYYMILIRNFFERLPDSVMESAVIDGCNDLTILARIVVPMSKPVIATISLFLMVNLWNTFMPGVLYLQDPAKYPLQVYVRLLVFGMSTMETSQMAQSLRDLEASDQFGSESLKMAVLMFTTIPIVCVYPLLQRHFVKGLVLGAVKG